MESLTGSRARRLSSWMKARLVATNSATRRIVWRLDSVCKNQPRGGRCNSEGNRSSPSQRTANHTTVDDVEEVNRRYETPINRRSDEFPNHSPGLVRKDEEPLPPVRCPGRRRAADRRRDRRAS